MLKGQQPQMAGNANVPQMMNNPGCFLPGAGYLPNNLDIDLGEVM